MGSDDWRIFLCLILASITAKDMKKDKKKKKSNCFYKANEDSKIQVKSLSELQKDACKWVELVK